MFELFLIRLIYLSVTSLGHVRHTRKQFNILIIDLERYNLIDQQRLLNSACMRLPLVRVI